MTIESLAGGGFDFVQPTVPSTPELGETWLDTSVNPPIRRVYNGSNFVRVDSDDTIATNLDQKVSNVSGGVDWSSKTPASALTQSVLVSSGTNQDLITISGSGYILGATFGVNKNAPGAFVRIVADGTVAAEAEITTFAKQNPRLNIFDTSNTNSSSARRFAALYRFDSSASINVDNQSSTDVRLGASIAHVLD